LNLTIPKRKEPIVAPVKFKFKLPKKIESDFIQEPEPDKMQGEVQITVNYTDTKYSHRFVRFEAVKNCEMQSNNNTKVFKDLNDV